MSDEERKEAIKLLDGACNLLDQLAERGELDIKYFGWIHDDLRRVQDLLQRKDEA